MSIVYEVKFFFVSDNYFVVTYSEEKFKKIIETMGKAWHNCWTAGEEFGVNFLQVTHYTVKKRKEDKNE